MEFPQPEVGLVISYSYLWSDEAEAGHVDGRKNRPCAIVWVVQQAEGKGPVVTVVPITHSPHRNSDAVIEIPAAIKRHLGLDDQPSWIVLDDLRGCPPYHRDMARARAGGRNTRLAFS